jgi:NAD(P)-dependent dehydrogenase (short-subunit alcohol dehydrogenase family)
MGERLAGKVCVITGAASGQGRVAAEVFAREGALLVLSDVDQVGLDEIAAIVRGAGADPALHSGDLTQEAPNEELMQLAVSRWGGLDGLYNAAGLVRFSPIHETSLDDWRFTIDHELTITFLACKHAVRVMLEHGGGSIVNISSVSGLFGSPRHAAHAATKAGITGLTKQLAVEYGPRGIRCNAIAPGFLVYAPGQRRVASQTRGMSPDHVPLRRFTRPEDTAYCALFLTSDEASYITGQVIIVDGGASAC